MGACGHSGKVNLYCDCEFWSDASMCFSKDCCVEACDDSEIPEPWRTEAAAHAPLEHAGQGAGEKGCSDPISPVDRYVETAAEANLMRVPNWSGLNNPWVPEDDAGVDYIYVNLQLNPERYTGYKGEDARRIWASIYAQVGTVSVVVVGCL
ncbi:hypothetical protein FOA52_009316 [Chlamydomonas sp. UWO 241]|nr:hypothetical protein FOA52_009316 [Chlamydomonas sp. UWO 241]